MFCFDEGKPFSVNFEAFLDQMKTVDPDMAEILRANADMLLAIVMNGERNTQARVDFNSLIAAALDNLVTKTFEKEGE